MSTTQEKLDELTAQIIELEEYRETVRLFEEGKKIQFQQHNPFTGKPAWIPTDKPTWEPGVKYRVAPGPITRWLIVQTQHDKAIGTECHYEESVAVKYCADLNRHQSDVKYFYRAVKLVEPTE